MAGGRRNSNGNGKKEEDPAMKGLLEENLKLMKALAQGITILIIDYLNTLEDTLGE